MAMCLTGVTRVAPKDTKSWTRLLEFQSQNDNPTLLNSDNHIMYVLLFRCPSADALSTEHTRAARSAFNI